MRNRQKPTRRLRGYKGNSLIKATGQEIEWQSEEIKEYAKCKSDPIYFIETYMKIIGNDGLENFVLYPYQRRMVLSFQENNNTIVTTARQAGKSTTTCGFILWYIIFHSEKLVALLANKEKTAREILDKVRFGYQHLPSWLQHGVEKWNEGSMELENNSRVIATSTSNDSIRGYTVDILFIDEAAHIENWDAFFTSTVPTVSSRKNSKIILVSTPNGLNYFYKTWVQAMDNKNNYFPIRVTWQEVPGRDEEWRLKALKELNNDEQKFAQEYCCEFQGSSGTLIAGWKLKELVEHKPIMKNESFCQYTLPEKKRVYIMVCDVSRGKGLDYSAFQVIDVTEMPYNQVAVFRNNQITPADYAEYIFRIAKAYNNASVLVEINDIGEQVSYMLHNDFEYENVLFTEGAGRNGKKITSGFGGANIDKGIRTTTYVKLTGCSILKLLIEQNQLIIKDKDTIFELERFSKSRTTYAAEAGCNDDLVMCLVLFAWLSDQQYFRDYTDINTLKAIKDKSTEEMDQDLLPFFHDDGTGEDGWSDIDVPKNSSYSWIWNSSEY